MHGKFMQLSLPTTRVVFKHSSWFMLHMLTCLFCPRPPHQIMAWVGLERYGYLEDAQRLAYRFLYMYVYP